MAPRHVVLFTAMAVEANWSTGMLPTIGVNRITFSVKLRYLDKNDDK